MLFRRGLVALGVMIFSAGSGADELLMKNGSRLVGTVVRADNDKIIFNTPFAGDITIEQVNVESIITEEPVTLLMEDGAVYRDKRIVTQEEKLIVFKEDKAPVTFDVVDIDFINPEPWRLGEGYKWFGSASAALESERGNTDTDEMDLAFESIWRSLVDRYTLRGSWEIDESNGEKNKDNWKLRSKYDRFSKSDPDNYYGVQAAFEYDKFADLDLRTIVGPYIGRQFFETSYLALQGELGLVYVDEQFDVAEDNDYWGSSWEMRLTSGIIPHTELYVNLDGLLNFEETSDVVANTTVGIKFPVLWGFTAGAEVKYEYDGGAVEGVDDTDETYNFRLGYDW